MERTLILLKPDAVHRGLIGRILTRFEEKGLKIVGLKMRQFPVDLIREHYAVHKERPFYASLVGFMTSAPVVAIALEGVGAIEVARNLIGATNSRKAAPGTIRGDLGADSLENAALQKRLVRNLVHTSDDADAARRDFGTWFGAGRRALLTSLPVPAQPTPADH